MAGYFGSLFGGGGAGSPSASAFTNPMVDPRQLALLMALQNNQGQGGLGQAGPRSMMTPGAAPGMPTPPQGMGANGAPRIGPNPQVMQQPGAGALTPQQIQALLAQLKNMSGQMGGAPAGGPMVAPQGPPQ